MGPWQNLENIFIFSTKKIFSKFSNLLKKSNFWDFWEFFHIFGFSDHFWKNLRFCLFRDFLDFLHSLNFLRFFLDFFLPFLGLLDFLNFFEFILDFFFLLRWNTKVNTKSYKGYYWTQKVPKMCQNSIISPFFAPRTKKALNRRPKPWSPGAKKSPA